MNLRGQLRDRRNRDRDTGVRWMRWIIFLAVVLVAAIALWTGRDRVDLPTPELPSAFDTAPRTERSDLVTLYFGARDYIGLRGELRTIAASPSLEARLQACVRELAAGSLEDGIAVIPPRTRLRGAFLDTWGVAYLDFSSDLLGRRPPDDGEEWLVVAAIVRTMCDNFPEVRAVRLLVDGEMVVSLGGYMDLEEPLRSEEFADAGGRPE